MASGKILMRTITNGICSLEKEHKQNKTTREVKSLWSLLWYFKFITDADNIFDIFQAVRCYLQFFPQIAHMVAYRFA